MILKGLKNNHQAKENFIFRSITDKNISEKEEKQTCP